MNRYGLIVEPESIKMYDAEVVLGAAPVGATYPKKFTLDRKAIVKDQGDTGSCLACTLATIAEYYFDIVMSPGWNYGEFRSESHKGYGLYASQALDAWKNIGQVPVSEFGILMEMTDMRDKTQARKDLLEIAKKYCISGYASMNYALASKKDAAIKEFLTTYKIPLVGVSNSYFNESHAIVIDGWNDETNCYTFQNSWGEEWKDKGYSEIPKNKLDGVYAVFFEPINIPFTDVEEDRWSYNDIKHMYLNGLINGTSETTFDPEGLLTREQAVAIINRLCTKLDNRNAKVYEYISGLENRVKKLEAILEAKGLM